MVENKNKIKQIRKRLSKGARKHVRRQKQEARKGVPVHR
jgi:hypothetical protein